jgi:hypothetical protein
MALYSVRTGKVTLTSGATQSLLLLNPAVVNVKVRGVSVSLDGSAGAAAVQFDLYRTSTVGSPAGTAVTPAQGYEADGAAQSSCLSVLTTEPSAVTVLDSWYVQPFGGLAVLQWPFGAEPVGKGGGNRVGVRYVAPSGVTPDCLCAVWFEE